jgi:hypothetical protein
MTDKENQYLEAIRNKIFENWNLDLDLFVSPMPENPDGYIYCRRFMINHNGQPTNLKVPWLNWEEIEKMPPYNGVDAITEIIHVLCQEIVLNVFINIYNVDPDVVYEMVYKPSNEWIYRPVQP